MDEEDEIKYYQRLRDFVRSKFERSDGDYYFPKPGAQFCCHVMLRSVQTGAMIGTLLGPIATLIERQKEDTIDRTSIVDSMVRGGINGALVGAALSPVISYGTIRNMNTMLKYKHYVTSKFDQSRLWQDHIAIASVAVGYMSSGKLGVVGLKQTEFELLSVPNPGAEFCVHVTMKSIQTGALLGSILGPLSTLIFKDQRAKAKNLREAFVDGGTQGAAIGAVLGPVLTYMSLKNMNSITLYDKCYRLRFNQQQLWQDRTAIVSAAVGYLSSGSLGFVVGVDLAVLMGTFMGKAW